MKEKLTLKDLAVKHDYYCSDSNYYSNQASIEYKDFTDFYNDYKDADVDMNLVFRWDLKKREEGGNGYYMEIFQMKQRKGIFTPICINRFEVWDIPLFLKYIKPHIEKLKSIWRPLEF